MCFLVSANRQVFSLREGIVPERFPKEYFQGGPKGSTERGRVTRQLLITSYICYKCISPSPGVPMSRETRLQLLMSTLWHRRKPCGQAICPLIAYLLKPEGPGRKAQARVNRQSFDRALL